MDGKRADMIVHDREPYNAEPPPAVLAAHALTPVPAFYTRNHGPVPRIDPAAWRLRVDGLVERPLELDLAAGPAEIIARAWDSTGTLQPERAEHVWNPKGSVNSSWARVRVVVRDDR